MNKPKFNSILFVLIAMFCITTPLTFVAILDWPLPFFPWRIIIFITLATFVAVMILLPTAIKRLPRNPAKKVSLVLYALLVIFTLGTLISITTIDFQNSLPRTAKYLLLLIMLALGGAIALLSPVAAVLALIPSFRKAPWATTIKLALIPILTIGLAWITYIYTERHNKMLQENMALGADIELSDFFGISEPDKSYALFIEPYADTTDGYKCEQLQLTTQDLDKMGIINNNSDGPTYIYAFNSEGLLDRALVWSSLVQGPPHVLCLKVSETVLVLDKQKKRYIATERQP